MKKESSLRRTQIYLTDRQHTTIGYFSKEIGISKSDYIRRVIDAHIDEKDNKKVK